METCGCLRRFASPCCCRHLLPLSVHVPVQLACLWVATATVGLLSSRAGTAICPASSLLGALATQVVGGFLLPTLAVYAQEQAERRRFWRGLAGERGARPHCA